MVMKALREGASGGIAKVFLFSFMVVAVGGMVFMDVGGFFRGGVAKSDVGRAGNETISLSSFDRLVEITLNRVGMSVHDAYKLGYINQILSAEIRGRLLRQAAGKTGILIDRKEVARKIHDLVAPMVGPDQTADDVLRQILANQGMTEKMFVDSMQRDMASSILVGAIQGGLQSDSIEVASDMYKYQNEKREIEYISFPDSDLKDLPEPKEEKLQELYESTKEAYATPEMRTLQLITVKTGQLKNTLEISDEEVRKQYDDNIDMFSSPASRTLDQALLGTEEQAKSVRAAVEKGKALKAAVTEVTGNPGGYVGEQDFEEKNLLDEIKKDVMAAEKPGEVIGPINTPLGWSVVIVSKINKEKTKSFDEVKKEIKDDLMSTHLSDEQYALAGTVDDMFAGGAAVDDVAKEVPLDIKSLPEMNRFGQDKDSKDALKDYADNRAMILEFGFSLETGETSPVFESADGKFLAVHAQKIEEKKYTPFAEVKDGLAKKWMSDQARITNQMRVAQILAAMGAENNAMDEIAKAHSKNVKSLGKTGRMDQPAAPFHPQAYEAVFNAPVGMPVSVEIDGGFAIASAKNSSWPEKIEVGSKEFKDLVQGLKKNNRDEGLILYMEQKRHDYGAGVNKALIDKRYGSVKPAE